MSFPTRAGDLRTTAGRSRAERQELKRLRRAYIKSHPKMEAAAICQEFKRRGWISPTTFSHDVIRGIENYRENDYHEPTRHSRPHH